MQEHAGNMLVASKAPSFTELHEKGEALLGHAESLLNPDKNPQPQTLHPETPAWPSTRNTEQSCP